MAPWTRLIRFVAEEDSQIYQGEPQLPAGISGWSAFDIGNQYEGLQAKLVKGDIYGANEISDETRTVKKLLSPVSKEQITLVRCVGERCGDIFPPLALILELLTCWSAHFEV